VDRCLEVYGLERYPKDFNRLVELQETAGGLKVEVVRKVLDYLDQRRHLDDLINHECEYVIAMIEQNMIKDTSVEHTAHLEAQL